MLGSAAGLHLRCISAGDELYRSLHAAAFPTPLPLGRLGIPLRIDYRVGAGEELPVPDAAFEVACCCDVLEHVSDVDRVISETARVLEPGGLYLFDTPTRTRTSKLIAIKAA
jgi:SAM-dependent methyltransferase